MGFLGKKYKKAAAAKPEDTTSNLAPSKINEDGLDLKTEKMPRAFRMVMHRNSMIEKAKTVKREKPKPMHVKKVGESVHEFHRRVDEDIRQSVNKAAKVLTKTAEKKKRRLNERKQKRESKGKKAKLDSDNHGEDGDEPEKEFPKLELIPFGTQAYEPPKFSVVPKKVGGGAGALRAVQAAMEAKEKKEREEAAGKRERMEEIEKKKDGALAPVGRKTKQSKEKNKVSKGMCELETTDESRVARGTGTEEETGRSTAGEGNRLNNIVLVCSNAVGLVAMRYGAQVGAGRFAWVAVAVGLSVCASGLYHAVERQRRGHAHMAGARLFCGDEALLLGVDRAASLAALAVVVGVCGPRAVLAVAASPASAWLLPLALAAAFLAEVPAVSTARDPLLHLSAYAWLHSLWHCLVYSLPILCIMTSASDSS
ncbi:hypothetical protein HK100_005171 [Physocladia obscura]|uniref:Uncharacterized protein n=1 Tax=Physocladia obscura TaxID=109957 RepID=A0AAD5SS68_9FUNG|nr:hypothetical protein HK100_005171 [Physocladia obscura]